MLGLVSASTALLQPATTLASSAAQRAAVSMKMSQALPFQECPPALDGSMAGDVGFDPLGFSNYELGPFETQAEHMAWMREAELKHGRVCMLATVGWLAVDWGLQAPGLPASLKGLSSYAAHDAAVAQGSLIVLMIFCGVAEIGGAGAIKASLDGERVPGDFALDGGFAKDEARMPSLRQAEIKHCRLAMMAFSGIVTQAGLAEGNIGPPYF